LQKQDAGIHARNSNTSSQHDTKLPPDGMILVPGGLCFCFLLKIGRSAAAQIWLEVFSLLKYADPAN
jgi:hypothetical protein